MLTPLMRTKRRMGNKVNWSWLTGFWEADGSVFIYIDKKCNNRYKALRMDISQKNERLLKRMLKFLNSENIKGSLQKYPSKDGCYSLRVSTRQAEKFIQKIYPFVVSKVRKDKIKYCIKQVNTSKNLKTKYTWRGK